MNPIRKGYLDTPMGQLHYRECGEGVSLILAHQSPVCSRMFVAAMPLLAQRGLRVIAIDTPSYGNSDGTLDAPSIDDYVDVFQLAIDKLSGGASHFLGHHTGAMIACRLANRAPSMVTSLIANGVPLLTPEEREFFGAVMHSAVEPREDGGHLLELWQTRLQYSPGWSNVQAMHDRLIDQLWIGNNFWHGFKAGLDYDMREDFSSLKMRTMILTNSGDDLYECCQRARALRPDMAYQELLGGTHDIVDEQPHAWARAVADFILARR